TSDELAPLRAKGARVASVHPMMTFVRGSVPDMAGVAFAVEGNAVATRAAREIVERLGGHAFPIRKQNKVLYHAFGSFASPLVVALMASLEDLKKVPEAREVYVALAKSALKSLPARNRKALRAELRRTAWIGSMEDSM